ncbi:unnamed protein product [Chrysodeixis includens]|uniref:Uncharacterized protein n=1 Tax=Chrysodeixis includens TaxID=689277 RepID=A0A9N8KXY1_CHRIL|nr:unnamed protein product [Chrysodeixis includens]
MIFLSFLSLFVNSNPSSFALTAVLIFCRTSSCLHFVLGCHYNRVRGQRARRAYFRWSANSRRMFSSPRCVLGIVRLSSQFLLCTHLLFFFSVVHVFFDLVFSFMYCLPEFFHFFWFSFNSLECSSISTKLVLLHFL